MTGQEMLTNNLVSMLLKSVGITKQQALGKVAELEATAKTWLNIVLAKVNHVDLRLERIETLLASAIKKNAELEAAIFNGVTPAGDSYEPTPGEIQAIVNSLSQDEKLETVRVAKKLQRDAR